MLLDSLSQFYQKGGKLLLSAPVSDELLARLQSLPSSQGVFVILDAIQPGGTRHAPRVRGDRPACGKHLEAALGQLLIPDVRIDHREVTHVHREVGGKHLYSGTAIYTQHVTLDEEYLSAEQIWIEVTEVADMVEFIVNNAQVAVRAWPPYRCEIRSLLHPGQNILALKITNSMQNFLEGETRLSGLLGCVCLKRLLSQ